eukprot:g4969.t1
MARRKTVSSWIEAITGVPVPSSSDYAFRSALRDGVLLCRLINHLKPSSVPQIMSFSNDALDDDEGSSQNIKSFLKAVEAYGMESESLFSLEDILEGTWQDRPKVVECLYRLQRKAEQIQFEGTSADGDAYFRYESYSTEESNRTDSASEYSQGLGDGVDSDSDFSRPESINKLMDQCTNILKDRTQRESSYDEGMIRRKFMGQGGGQNAMKCLESMLKQILSGITTAQERRGRRDLEQSEKYIRSLEDQITVLQQQPKKAVREMFGLSDEEVITLRKTADELSQKLIECQNENAVLERALTKETVQKEELAMKINDIRSEVQNLDGIRNKYKEVQQENSKLYNMVQDLRGNIRVFCRVRPVGLTGDSTGRCVDCETEEGTILVRHGATSDNSKTFKFDKVFGETSTQDEVYAECQPLIRSVLDGYNVCIFAYGQTGSGKTHTMSGTNVVEYSGRGINYRALDDLFHIKRTRSDEVDYQINVQMLEIYNESLRDLLFDYSSGAVPQKLDIKSTQESGCNVPEAVQRPVSCTKDVLDVMSTGQRNRSVGSTAMNARSSRSHSVLTVIVAGYNHVTKDRTHGCLHLVDLAGSERISRSEATGDRLKEAQHINRSLSALGDVMSDLAAKNSHVPFRNSKLTQLLKDSLSGQAKAMMFMHISPEDSSRGETLSTLNFGSRVGQITLGQASKNVERGSTMDAMSKLKMLSHAKDDKIVELNRVIETDRAFVRKSEVEKAALEKELRSLREELQLSQRSLMSARLNSRRKNGGECLSSTRLSSVTSETSSQSSKAELRMSRSTNSRKTSDRQSSRSSRNEESEQKSMKTSMASRGEESSARRALLRGLTPASRSIAPGDSPPLPRSSAARALHKKSMSMTSRDCNVGATNGHSNPRRAVLKKSETTGSSIDPTKRR